MASGCKLSGIWQTICLKFHDRHIWEYDIDAKTWIRKNDFPGGARQFALGFTVNGKGYLANGQHISFTNGIPSGSIYKDFWAYDANNDSWTKVGTFDFLSDNMVNTSSIFVINQKAYLVFARQLWVQATPMINQESIS